MGHNDWWVTERLEGNKRPSILHKVKLPDDIVGGWYWQICSGETFLSRVLHRWHNKYTKGKAKNTLIAFKKYDPEFNSYYDDLETIEHNNLWEFYEYIGYDHKDKKVANIDKFIRKM